MRFDRIGFCEFRDTYRKRLAVLRRQSKERDRYPLFADQVAAQQHRGNRVVRCHEGTTAALV